MTSHAWCPKDVPNKINDVQMKSELYPTWSPKLFPNVVQIMSKMIPNAMCKGCATDFQSHGQHDVHNMSKCCPKCVQHYLQNRIEVICKWCPSWYPTWCLNSGPFEREMETLSYKLNSIFWNFGLCGCLGAWHMTILGSQNVIVRYHVLVKYNILFSIPCIPSNVACIVVH